MQQKQDIWGGMSFSYFFLAATGAGLMAVTVIFDLLSGGFLFLGYMSFAALVLSGVGALLLLLELTQIFRFLNVFRNLKSIMAIGAWILMGFIIFTAIYTSFWISIFPWTQLYAVRQIVGLITFVLGILLVLYPALEMGETKGRPFWQGAGLVPIFLVSSFVSGLGLSLIFFSLGRAPVEFLVLVEGAVVWAMVAQLIFASTYLLSASNSVTYAALGAQNITKGFLSNLWWWGAVVVGHIVPWVLYLLPPSIFIYLLQGIFIVFGVFAIRYCWFFAPPRILLPGEEEYLRRPVADAELLKKISNPWVGEVK